MVSTGISKSAFVIIRVLRYEDANRPYRRGARTLFPPCRYMYTIHYASRGGYYSCRRPQHNIRRLIKNWKNIYVYKIKIKPAHEQRTADRIVSFGRFFFHLFGPARSDDKPFRHVNPTTRVESSRLILAVRRSNVRAVCVCLCRYYVRVRVCALACVCVCAYTSCPHHALAPALRSTPVRATPALSRPAVAVQRKLFQSPAVIPASAIRS